METPKYYRWGHVNLNLNSNVLKIRGSERPLRPAPPLPLDPPLRPLYVRPLLHIKVVDLVE